MLVSVCVEGKFKDSAAPTARVPDAAFVTQPNQPVDSTRKDAAFRSGSDSGFYYHEPGRAMIKLVVGMLFDSVTNRGNIRTNVNQELLDCKKEAAVVKIVLVVAHASFLGYLASIAGMSLILADELAGSCHAMNSRTSMQSMSVRPSTDARAAMTSGLDSG